MQGKTKRRFVYLGLFLVFFVVELLIALFVNDNFVRPYIGDILVIVLLSCLARVVFPQKPRFLGIYMIFAGVIAEILQLIELDKLLGIEGTALGVVIGSTFDVKDIVCYTIGGLIFFVAEAVILNIKGKNA